MLPAANVELAGGVLQFIARCDEELIVCAVGHGTPRHMGGHNKEKVGGNEQVGGGGGGDKRVTLGEHVGITHFRRIFMPAAPELALAEHSARLSM